MSLVKVYYEDILVGEFVTNRSMTVDEALKHLDFNEEEFIESNGFDDIDYNDFRLDYNTKEVIDMVTVNGKHFDYDTVVDMMDDEIREYLHGKLVPCSQQTFVDAYVKAHEEKFNEEFVIN